MVFLNIFEFIGADGPLALTVNLYLGNMVMLIRGNFNDLAFVVLNRNFPCGRSRPAVVGRYGY